MDSDDHRTQPPSFSTPRDEGGGGLRAPPEPDAAEQIIHPEPGPPPAANVAGRDPGSAATQLVIKPEEKVRRPRGRNPRASAAKDKQKSTSPPLRSKEKKDDEDVCFICFDGGDLVLCDRRGCPKAYHPACIKRDQSFFRSKAKWNCGWHICTSCQKAAHYLCYTCTYSLCKSCAKGADYICIRENKGLCTVCRKTIMLIENVRLGNEEKVQVDFDDQTSWEYLFKVYWSDLKEKLSLTIDEITRAKNPRKERKRKSRETIENVHGMDVKLGRVKRGGEIKSVFCQSTEWASKDLLEFVAYMKGGDTSVLTRFDVQALLLEYISRNNLHDPRQKWQIFCDGRLVKLFGRPSVDHFEMLKLLDSHFHVKENTQVDGVNRRMLMDAVPGHMDIDLNSDKQLLASSTQQNPTCPGFDERTKDNQDNYAAVDAHDINLVYLRKNSLRSLIDDPEQFNRAVIGSAVRIRICGSEPKQEMYRIVQVVGTCTMRESYRIDDKTTNIKLEIQNLDKKEFVSIVEVSNEDFTKDEYRCLRQSIRCGLVKWFAVDEIQQKISMVKSEKVVEEREASGMNCWNSQKNHTDAISSLTRDALSGNGSEISPSPLSTGTEQSVNDDETCKMWQYKDRNGKVQGPFTIVQMHKWRTVGQLSLDVRIWRINEKQEESILLADALNGHFIKDPTLVSQETRVTSDDRDSNWDGVSSISVDTNKTAEGSCNAPQNSFNVSGRRNHEVFTSSEMGSCFSSSTVALDVDSADEKKNIKKSESLDSLKECGISLGHCIGTAEAKGRSSGFIQCNGNLDSVQSVHCKPATRCSVQKQSDGDGISSQSSGQNWKALSPVISSSNDWSSKARVAPLANSVENSQQKGVIDFLDLPNSGPPESTACNADKDKRCVSSNFFAEELGQTNRGGSERARYSHAPVKLEEWDSAPVSSTGPPQKSTECSIDGAALTLGSAQMMESTEPNPLPPASSWQAMVLEPVEITSLPEEAVSDLLAELEASEPLDNKNDGFGIEADFFPVLSPSTIRNELPMAFNADYTHVQRMTSQENSFPPSARNWQAGNTASPNHFLGSQMADPRWGAVHAGINMGWGGVSHGYRNVYMEPGQAAVAAQGNVNIVGSNYGANNNNRCSSSPRDQFFEGLNLDLGRGCSLWDNRQ